MNRWAILILVLVILSVCLVSSFGGISINSVIRPGTTAPSSSGGARQPSESGYTGVSSTGVSGRPAIDPNKVIANIKSFAGLERELTAVSSRSRDEIMEWPRPVTSTDTTRARLARAVQRQVAEELNLLRKIATEEGAKKTAAAIDGVLLTREIRLKKLSEKMEANARKARGESSSTGGYDSRRRSSSGGYRRPGSRSRSGVEEPVEVEPGNRPPVRRSR